MIQISETETSDPQAMQGRERPGPSPAFFQSPSPGSLLQCGQRDCFIERLTPELSRAAKRRRLE